MRLILNTIYTNLLWIILLIEEFPVDVQLSKWGANFLHKRRFKSKYLYLLHVARYMHVKVFNKD